MPAAMGLDLIRQQLAIPLGSRIRQRALGRDDLLVEVGKLGAQVLARSSSARMRALGLFEPGVAGSGHRQLFGRGALFRKRRFGARSGGRLNLSRSACLVFKIFSNRSSGTEFTSEKCHQARFL